MTVGQILKMLREEKKLTTREIAKLFNMGKSTISNYENDIRKPDYEVLKKFADFFNVSVDFLLGKTSIRDAYVVDNKQTNPIFNEIKEEYVAIAKQMQDDQIDPERAKKIIEILKGKL